VLHVLLTACGDLVITTLLSVHLHLVDFWHKMRH